jgi:SAM-dependent methyltransferase
MTTGDMGRFWDARARGDAFYFVDNTGTYRDADVERFWAEGRRNLDTLLGVLGAEVTSSDVVLDVGCGVGRLTRVLAQRAAHVHAIDVSAEMLQRARELNAHLTNVSNDPSLHRPRAGVVDRLKAAVGRAPKAQDEPQWLGSAVDLDDLRGAAADGGLEIANVVGEGTQFCYVHTVKPG